MFKKKLLCILMIIAMLVTYMPSTTFADSAENNSNGTTIENKQDPVLLATATSKGNNSVKLSWNKIPGATKYVVRGAKCGGIVKSLKITKKTTVKFNSIRKKKFKAHKCYKFVVTAFDKKGNKLAKSSTMHLIIKNTLGKYANAKSITASDDSIQLDVDAQKNVGAIVKIHKNKKHLTVFHGPEFIYKSSNKNVATVNGKGLVTGVSSGDAIIYIQDTRGIYCKTAVKVIGKPEEKEVGDGGTTSDVQLNTVTFNMSGLGRSDVRTVKKGTKIDVPEVPEADGHTFLDWYSNEDCSGDAVVFPYKVDNDVTFYAKWHSEKVEYQIRYYQAKIGQPNEFELAKTELIEATADAIVSAEAAEIEGFKFISENANNVTTGKVKGNGSLALRFYYSRNSYAIDINLDNDGPTPNALYTYQYGDTVKLSDIVPSADPTKEGFYFGGWDVLYIDAQGETKHVDVNADNEFLMPAGPVTIKAKWQDVKMGDAKFIVEHYLEKEDSADGYKIEDKEYLSGTIGTTASAEAYQKNYKGFSYNTEKSRNAEILEDGTTVLTLYYDRDSYLVSYDLAGGTGSVPSAESYRYGTAVEISGNGIVRGGYVFDGWKASYSDGDKRRVVTIVENEFDMPAGPVIITAKWKQTEKETEYFTVNFKNNGHGLEYESQTVPEGGLVTKPQPEPSEEGYVFGGWFVRSDLSGDAWNFDADVVEDNINLYAKWKPIEYTIEFYKNNDSAINSMEPMHMKYGEQKTLTVNAFALQNYKFEGWALSSDGPVLYTNGATVKNLTEIDGDVVKLYAKWTSEGNAVIQYKSENEDMGVVSNAIDVIDKVNGSPAGSTATAKAGYEFVEWTTTTDPNTSVGNEATFVPQKALNNEYSSETYIAHFDGITYTINYNANFGTGSSMMPTTGKYGEELTLRQNAYTGPKGKVFAGWNTEKDGSGRQYSNGATVKDLTTDNEITLYAQWHYPIGGRIYYVDNVEDNVDFTFYDIDGNELTVATESVKNLKTAAYYEIDGTPKACKFYVYATVDGRPDSEILIGENLQWGAFGTSIGTDFRDLGGGISNTDIGVGEPSALTPDGSGTTVWTWIKGIREESKYNCTNWFIGTIDEMDAIYNSSTPASTYFNNKNFWSSTEYIDQQAYNWDATTSKWLKGNKNNTANAVALRTLPSVDYFTVTFDNQGHGDYVAPIQVVSGSRITDAPWLTEDRFIFDDWYKDQNFTQKWDFNDDRVTEDTTLYGHWIPKGYTVMALSNGGSGGQMDPQEFEQGEEKALEQNEYEAPEGKVFVGWNTKEDYTGIHYTDEQVVKDLTEEDEIELFAEWAYPTGGRIFYIDDIDDEVEYSFYKEDGTKITDEFTLSNLAEAAYYNVSDTPIKGKYYVYATNGGMPEDNILIKKNMSWGADDTETGMIYDTVGTGEINTEIALTDMASAAVSDGTIWKWIKDQRELNSGEGLNKCTDWFIPSNREHDLLKQSTASGRTCYDEAFIASSVEMDENEAYCTYGKSNTKDYYVDGKEYSDYGAVAFRTLGLPDYDSEAYTIEYNLDGGNTGKDKNPTAYTSQRTITLVDPIKTGYTFTGWSGTGLNGSTNKGVVINAGSTGNRTYTAHWQANTYRIEFNSYGTQSGRPMETIRVEYDEEIDLPENTYEKTGHSFIGWAAKPAGEVVYSDEAVVSNLTSENNDTITLYAVWGENMIALKYTVNNSKMGKLSIGGEAVSSTTGNPKGSTATANLGYHFVKWTLDGAEKGTDPTFKPSKESTPDGSMYVEHTYVAVFEPNTYTIKYEGNGADTETSGTMPSVSATYGTPVKAPECKYTKGTHNTVPDRFMNWKGSDGKTYNVGDKVDYPAKNNGTETYTLTAQWEKHYAITIYNNGIKEASSTQKVLDVVAGKNYTIGQYFSSPPDSDLFVTTPSLIAYTSGREGTGDFYRKGMSYSFYSDKTLYAQFAERIYGRIVYTLDDISQYRFYDSNGYKCSYSSDTCEWLTDYHLTLGKYRNYRLSVVRMDGNKIWNIKGKYFGNVSDLCTDLNHEWENGGGLSNTLIGIDKFGNDSNSIFYYAKSARSGYPNDWYIPTSNQMKTAAEDSYVLKDLLKKESGLNSLYSTSVEYFGDVFGLIHFTAVPWVYYFREGRHTATTDLRANHSSSDLGVIMFRNL